MQPPDLPPTVEKPEVQAKPEEPVKKRPAVTQADHEAIDVEGLESQRRRVASNW